MKYLEQKDPSMHARAKEVIRDCAKKNKDGNPAYSSLSASMQSHLKKLVGGTYWKKAEEYLKQYMTQQYFKAGMPIEDAKKKATEMAALAASPLSLDPSSASASMPPAMQRVPGPLPGPGPHGQQPLRPGQTIVPPQQQARRPPNGGVPPNVNPTMMPPMNNPPIPQQQQPKAGQVKKERRQSMQDSVMSTTSASTTATASTTPTPAKKTKKKNTKTTSKKKEPKATSDSKQGRTPTPTTKKKPKPNKKQRGSPTAGASTSAPGSAGVSSKPSTVTPSEPPRPKPVKVAPPKEYSEIMETLDHVVDYDIRSCMVILGDDKKNKDDLNISKEQKKMLYHEFGITKLGPRKSLDGDGGPNANANAVPGTSDAVKVEGSSQKSEALGATKSGLPSYLQGWDKRNLISTRIAWSKLRLEEEETQKLSEISLPSMSLPLPTSAPDRAQSNTSVTVPPDASNAASDSGDWFNEEQAEEDQALALISEATQYYIKTILEDAMSSASKRLNLDGIRIWHQQHAAAASKAEEKAKGVTSSKVKPPPLHLRLGCDTKRQYSLVQGNAAKTYQRLEEALSRQPTLEFNAEALYNASNMMELSKIPKISGAAKKASYNAKRIFEIHGGKESSDPPLGRVPKKAKIMVHDFRNCLNGPAFRLGRKGLASSSAFV